MDLPNGVLIVEDEALLAMALRIELENEGIPVCGNASTKNKAVELVDAEHPDVVLMDIRLAGAADGITAAREIKQRADTEIIFMTGYNDNELRNKAEELKPLGFLTKPVDRKTLIDLLKNFFKTTN